MSVLRFRRDVFLGCGLFEEVGYLKYVRSLANKVYGDLDECIEHMQSEESRDVLVKCLKRSSDAFRKLSYALKATQHKRELYG